ncbi:pyridoxal-5'-phosphate-dependent protein subunit beta [Streptomyces mobaraensis NBRC 13819 = DSM 40847]|uniref:Pyridoxal-5'-phosphate-dependent protein subunit beta n=1 Tax=Streptomyces mobaraensis (strain ATCC 29032 / DSM 40847 / JCM 4168 / NBRC 13819 / NCIMB 11159 / IPCR 16-22) TaxID=1223523 RepID=M3C1M5_STRM1|nr:threonine synthase [Streptomyces mobaraensis]EME97890.1 pyridoxal-5'-phosphate-dependent protein subunit beta [Streptomyces mobaraensis NBRC 13819 = DSM 40847]
MRFPADGPSGPFHPHTPYGPSASADAYDPDAPCGTIRLRCGTCGRLHALAEPAWRCADCHGLLDLHGFTPAMPNAVELGRRPPTLWRYAEALPLPRPPRISLGEGMTPLISAPGRPDVLLKADHLMPTGSFKDRGAVLLVALAARLGVRKVMADSSGNTGTAVAAYAARAGLACEVYVPAATSEGKVAQLRAYGAEVRRIEGSREDTAAEAARAAEEPGTFYASHVHHPFFPHGTKTYVFELWEQLGGRLPGTLVLPAGNGTLVLGARLGCQELLDQRLIDRLPAITAVQAAGCAPLARAAALGGEVPERVTAEPTVAEGIAIARPARGSQVLQAVRETGGTFVTVPEDRIVAAHRELARHGLYVEPTSAVCWAALQEGLVPEHAVEGDRPFAVVPLCGNGLKGKPPE